MRHIPIRVGMDAAYFRPYQYRLAVCMVPFCQEGDRICLLHTSNTFLQGCIRWEHALVFCYLAALTVIPLNGTCGIDKLTDDRSILEAVSYTHLDVYKRQS